MEYDLIIIGAGWAGFNAALKAKSLGLKTALIEQERIGGTCLNRGCIPTKTLIQSAKIYSLTKKSGIFGIETQEPKIRFEIIQERKDKIIRQLGSGMEAMLKDIDFLRGQARLISTDKLEVNQKQLRPKSILIATGSKPQELKGLEFDGKKIISSDDILVLKEIPKTLLIIGGGVIGCEFASLFSVLGSRVSLVEKMPQLLPGEDTEIAKKIELLFKKRGIKVDTNTDALSIDLNNYDRVLVCIGRIPQTQYLNLDKAGVGLKGQKIILDRCFKTSCDNIYAAGDCAGGAMLAHLAARQGILAVENISGKSSPLSLDNIAIPNCIFTDPEISSVGLNEEKAKLMNLDFKIDKFDFLSSGMARILDETEGFLKIISDKKTDLFLGASIIGPRATELIGILTLALESKSKISQLRNIILAHPTICESISEAIK